MKNWNYIKDKASIAKSLNNIGSIYGGQGKYNKALEYYEKSLKISKEIGDITGITGSLNNIGIIYIMQKNLEKGKAILSEALEIAKNINNQELINDINQIFDQLNNNEN